MICNAPGVRSICALVCGWDNYLDILRTVCLGKDTATGPGSFDDMGEEKRLVIVEGEAVGREKKKKKKEKRKKKKKKKKKNKDRQRQRQRQRQKESYKTRSEKRKRSTSIS